MAEKVLQLTLILSEKDYRKLYAVAVGNSMTLEELVSDLLERNIEQYEKVDGQIFLAGQSATPR